MKKKKVRIPYALKDGRIVYIDDVERGLACGCTCPKCGQPLKARKGEVREKHFAHHGDVECKGAYEETKHRLAIQILQDEKRVMAPPYENVALQEQLIFSDVDVEVRNMAEGIIPDVVGTCNDGTKICIEVRCTHAVDEEKLSKIRALGLHCLEIDIRKHRMDEAELRTFLLDSVEERKWLNHPEYEKSYQEKKANEEERNKAPQEKMHQASQALNRHGASTDSNNRKEPTYEYKVVPRPEVAPLTDGPIKDYYENLHPHGTFHEYTEAHTVAVNYGLSLNRKSIFVIHAERFLEGVRLPFHLSRITFKDGEYVAEHIGAYPYESMAERTYLSLKTKE
ncbi:MAG: hypothetical protein IJ197_04115 [Bacteroidaceae bacterium]|nr:hypothetical protein [Bacteroidaceae bacterium]